MDVQNDAFHEKVVFTFLKKLQEALNEIDPTLSPSTLNQIHEKIFTFIDLHLSPSILLTQVMNSVFFDKPIKPNLITATYLKWQELRTVLKKITWLRAAVIAARSKMSKPITALSEINKPPSEKFLKFSEPFRTASDQQLKQLAQHIAQAKKETFLKAEKAIRVFNEMDGKKCALLSSVFGTTWSPLFSALRDLGWSTTAVFHGDVKKESGYGVMPTSEIPIDEFVFTDAFGQMLFMSSADNAPILINGEAYYSASWNALNALVLYLISSVIVQTVLECRPKTHNNIYFIMYDALKPLRINCREIKHDLSKFYKAHMGSADKIILNSNGKSFVQFLKNCYGIQNPVLFFPRYSVAQKKPKERLSFGENSDEFHMVCITTCLDQTQDGARDTAPHIIRTILHQGIHFHYYHNDPKENVRKFVASILPEYRHFFHEYPVDRDQVKLVDELHQYHIGINPSDYWAIMQGVCSFEDRQYADAQAIYVQSTFPTSAMVYAAAGLPVTLPHMLFDCNTFLHETTIPMVLSEFKNLKNHLIARDLKALCEIANKKREIACVKKHIHQVDTFLSTATSPPKSNPTQSKETNCISSMATVESTT